MGMMTVSVQCCQLVLYIEVTKKRSNAERSASVTFSACNSIQFDLFSTKKSTSAITTKASNLNRKWSGIRIQTSGLIRIRILVSAGSLPKCCGSTRRVLWKSADKCMRNANKFLKNPLFCNGEGSGKLIRNPHPGPDHHRKLISSSDQ